MPAAEAPLVERWDGKALLYDYCDHQMERFVVDRVIPAGSTHVWGDLEWSALAAPGHDMGALVFHNAEHGILISGDALWEHGFGFVMPPEIDAAAMPATRATLEMLATLDIRVVIPGHGEPFTDVAGALDRARRRVEAFAADSRRIARHALKVNLMFALLDKQRMPLAGLPAYVERVGIYREFNAHLLPRAAGTAGRASGRRAREGRRRADRDPATSCPWRTTPAERVAPVEGAASGASTRWYASTGTTSLISSAGLLICKPDVIPQSERLIDRGRIGAAHRLLVERTLAAIEIGDLEASPAWSPPASSARRRCRRGGRRRTSCSST